MREKRPIIITFFGDLYVLGALLLLLPLIPGFSEGFGIYSPPLPTFLKVHFLSENIMILLLALLLLVVAYGFFKVKIWAYWLAIFINIYPLVAGIFAAKQSGRQSFYGNIITTIMGLVFLIPTIKYFSREQKKSE